jgi:hypothetical protein
MIDHSEFLPTLCIIGISLKESIEMEYKLIKVTIELYKQTYYFKQSKSTFTCAVVC